MNQNARPKVEELKRRSERVLLRIPIEVKGRGADGKPFREKTFTLVINRNGARISLKNSPQSNDRITIQNLQNEMSCPFRVVARTGKSLGEGPEWGVECLEPEVNFWGISFPQKVERSAAEEMIDALLECSGCHFRELAQLTLEQYRALSTRASLGRYCAECDATMEWKFGFAEAEPDEAGPSQAAQTTALPMAQGEAERRRAKRLTAKLSVRIRLKDGREEVTRTENLSQTGVCLISDQMMDEGDSIQITVGYSPGSDDIPIPARIIWRKPLEGTHRAVYGVQLQDT